MPTTLTRLPDRRRELTDFDLDELRRAEKAIHTVRALFHKPRGADHEAYWIDPWSQQSISLKLFRAADHLRSLRERHCTEDEWLARVRKGSFRPPKVAAGDTENPSGKKPEGFRKEPR